MAPTQPQRAQAKPRASAANYVIWGSLAVCAVLMTSGMVALSINGGRGPFSVAQTTTTRPPAQPVVQRPQGVPEFEMARLQDALRAMAAEREQLSARIEQLERSVGDITASINTVKERPAPPPVQAAPPKMAPPPPAPEAALPPPPPPAPPPVIAAIPSSPPPLPPAAEPLVAAPTPVPPAAEAPRAPAPPPLAGPTRPGQISARPPTAKTIQIAPKFPAQAARPSLQPPVQISAAPKPPLTQVQQVIPPVAANQQSSAADSIVTRTEFGIDLGGETSMDGLRARWANVKGNHSIMLEGMRPLVSVREGQKPGTVELRLIAGPVPNAGAAARVCANLQTTGVACQATEFDGQKLSLR
jgi:hypothetical protein